MLSGKMNLREGKNRAFAIFMATLLLLALVSAMSDPSCHRPGDRPGRLEPSR